MPETKKKMTLRTIAKALRHVMDEAGEVVATATKTIAGTPGATVVAPTATAAANPVETQAVLDRIKALEDASRARPLVTTPTRTLAAPSNPLSGIDWKNFSVAKTLLCLNDRRTVGDRVWDMYGAGYEKEVHELVYKTLSSADPALGGFLVAPELQQAMIEPLRSTYILDQLPIMRMPGLTGSPVPIPRQTSSATASWVGETSTVSATDQATDLIQLQPHKARGATKITMTLIRRAPQAAEMMVRKDVAAVIIRLAEKAFFEGNGTTQPIGLSNISGINTVSAASGNADARIIKTQQMIEEVEVDNGDFAGRGVFVCHPRIWHDLKQIQILVSAASATTTGTPSVPWLSERDPQGKVQRMLHGYPVYITTNLTVTTTGVLYFFDPGDTIFADWGPVELKVTDEGQTLRLADQMLVTGMQEVDCEARHPVSVCTLTYTF